MYHNFRDIHNWITEYTAGTLAYYLLILLYILIRLNLLFILFIILLFLWFLWLDSHFLKDYRDPFIHSAAAAAAAAEEITFLWHRGRPLLLHCNTRGLCFRSRRNGFCGSRRDLICCNAPGIKHSQLASFLIQEACM